MLGIQAGEMESSSNFRRRRQKFVHRGVLQETSAPCDEGGWSDASIMNHSPDSPLRRFEHDLTECARAFAPEPGRTSAPPNTPDADERLARLERMMRAMEKRLGGGDAIP